MSDMMKSWIIPTNSDRLSERHDVLGPYTRRDTAVAIMASYLEEGIGCDIIRSATRPVRIGKDPVSGNPVFGNPAIMPAATESPEPRYWAATFMGDYYSPRDVVVFVNLTMLQISRMVQLGKSPGYDMVWNGMPTDPMSKEQIRYNHWVRLQDANKVTR